MRLLELVKNLNSSDQIAFFAFLVNCIYVLLVSATLWYVGRQFTQQKKEHRLHETLTMFEKLQREEMVEARRYIYENLPETIERLDDRQLIIHIQKTEKTFIAFTHVSYLLQEEYIDKEPILENYWAVIWKCWKKGEGIIAWIRKRRGDEYLSKFEGLFRLSEEYRARKQLPEPKIYGISRIIT